MPQGAVPCAWLSPFFAAASRFRREDDFFESKAPPPAEADKGRRVTFSGER